MRRCLHEAGHAVAWLRNGDSAALVVCNPSAQLTADQKALSSSATMGPGHGGYTISQAKERRCGEAGCEGEIRIDELNSFQIRFHLSSGCDGCMELLTDHCACIFAGGAATDLLPRGECQVDITNWAFRKLNETKHDRSEIDRIADGIIQDSEQRAALKDKARLALPNG